jgi:hypothetical protein
MSDASMSEEDIAHIFGVSPRAGTWHPIETAPKDHFILVTDEDGIRIDQVKWVRIPNGEGYNWITMDGAWQPNAALKYWMPCPSRPSIYQEWD